MVIWNGQCFFPYFCPQQKNQKSKKLSTSKTFHYLKNNEN